MAGRARGAEAAYQTVARDLRAGILRGEYTDGRLPTEAELSRTYGVSRQTVRRAFHDLVAEGMVSRFPGRGTFVAPTGAYLRQFGSVEDLMGLSLDTTLEMLTPLRRTVDVDAAGRLRLPSDAVYAAHFRRHYEDTPFCVTSVYLPPDVGRLLDDVPELARAGARSVETVIGLLDARLASPIAEAEQSITAARATPALADRLACEDGAPLLRIDRLYYAASGAAVELATSYFLPDRYSYRVRLRRSGR
ncbi:GntR family transcriptional regulator [Luedemannella helvata]|uniref:GntR family transcriptional regulator n=1 Tax=Luedemannella helvata TaxID=349315 RepID=A0ABP4VVF3_9ACTN